MTVTVDVGVTTFGWLATLEVMNRVIYYLVTACKHWCRFALGNLGALVRPNTQIISVSGDGGFLFSAQELETAVRLKAKYRAYYLE